MEITDYIDDNYELDEIETIYLGGDGVAWIKEGINWLPKVKYVLDRYHLNKYITVAIGHLPKMRPRLWEGLNRCDIVAVKETFKEIIANTPKGTKKKL
ncbi:MAG: hypothetical protein GX190_04705 [Mollicutes bacterium]|nr:hypothetical protein [Mollicutes bacterium]